VHAGIRSTAADFVGSTGDNLTIWTDTTVDKINLSKVDDEWVATSVDIIHSDIKATIKANKEIIVSAGAYCSPAILLRSGIGSKSEVESFGIERKVDLPGVGKNLMDHLNVFLFYEVNTPDLTTDHLIYSKDGFQNSYKLWKKSKTGFLSTFPFGAFAFARLDDRLKDSPQWREAPRKEGRDPMGLSHSQPNVEFFSTECYEGPKQYDALPGEGTSTFAIVAELFGTQSRGYVTLKSKGPLENPVVDHKYLDNPLDLLVLSEACRFANEIVLKGDGTKDIVKGSWPANLTHHTFTTREDWESYVKSHATTCYHSAGTCKMGRRDDSFAVLDERLRVYGVKNLRVADTSAIPILHSGHTQMPAYGIGEKCADMIKEDR